MHNKAATRAKRRIPGGSLRWWVGVAVCMWFGLASDAGASIVLPELATYEPGRAQAGAAQSTSSTQRQWPGDRDRSGSDQQRAAATADSLLASESGMSTSSSTSQVGGSGAAACHHSDVVFAPGLLLAGRLSSEAALLLPSPPGNDLLRPPQAV